MAELSEIEKEMAHNIWLILKEVSEIKTKLNDGPTMEIHQEESKPLQLTQQLFNIDEAAKILHYSPSTLRRLNSAGKIQYIKPGHKILYKVEYLEEFIANCEKEN